MITELLEAEFTVRFSFDEKNIFAVNAVVGWEAGELQLIRVILLTSGIVPDAERTVQRVSAVVNTILRKEVGVLPMREVCWSFHRAVAHPGGMVTLDDTRPKLVTTISLDESERNHDN